MTEEQHKWLFLTIRDLDGVIPNPEAAVQITSDDDICTFAATQEGYLRLGVEMLKAATVTPGTKEEDGALRLDFDLTRLMAPGNEFEPERFLMVDAIPPLPGPEPYEVFSVSPWRDRLSTLILCGIVAFLFLALIVGTAVIVSFLLRVML
jgi:hypothetical protein